MSAINCTSHNKLSQVRSRAMTWSHPTEDRFIPRRGSLNLTKFNLFSSSDSPPNPDLSSEFTELLKDSLVKREESQDKKAFFKYREPKEKKNSLPKKKKKERTKRRFSIPDKPFKVLDAPEMSDDFYRNILDWSSKNQLAVCLNNSIYILDTLNGGISKLYEAYECETITSLKWNPDGSRLAVGNLLGQVGIWDIDAQREIFSMDAHTDRVGTLDWQETLLSGSKDCTIVQSDPRIRQARIGLFDNHGAEVCQLKWSPDQKLFASGGNDNKMFVWSPQNKMPVMSESHNSCVKALAWSKRQYGILASGGGSADRMIKTWNTSTREGLFSRDTGSQVCSLAYSSHTNDIVSSHGYPDNEINVWRANGLKKVGRLTGHTERVLNIDFSPCGSILVSGASDDTLRFWRLYKQEEKESRKHGLSEFSRLR